MFERFTERAKRSLFVARHNAFLDGSRLIAGHHLLHALLAENDATVRKLLARLDVSADRVRALLAPIPPIAGDPRIREIPFSEAFKRVLTFGADEADTLNHVGIGPEHLLLGLLRAEGAAAGGPLTQSGVHIEAVRIAVREGPSEQPAKIRNNVFRSARQIAAYWVRRAVVLRWIVAALTSLAVCIALSHGWPRVGSEAALLLTGILLWGGGACALVAAVACFIQGRARRWDQRALVSMSVSALIVVAFVLVALGV